MGKYLIILLFTFGLTHSKAEIAPPTFRTVEVMDGSDQFSLSHVAADSVGSTFWGGMFSDPTASLSTLTVTNPGNTSAACLFKLGANMDGRWAKVGGAAVISGLAVDTARNCYVALHAEGNSITFDNVSYNSPSNWFTVVIKYSNGGNRIWEHQVDGVRTFRSPRSLAVDENNNVFFGGAYQGSELSFLRKLNSTGGTVWTRTGDKIQIDQSFSLRADSAGNCLMLSSFTNASVTFGGNVLQNRGVQSYLLVKYDSVGNVAWARRGGGNGPGPDYGIDFAVDGIGNSYVLSSAGSTNFLFGTNDIPLADPSWIVAKYNAMGEPRWSRSFTRGQSIRPYEDLRGGVTLDANEELLISASEQRNYDFYSAGFLGKLTRDGTILWMKKSPMPAEFPEETLLWSTPLISTDTNSLYVAASMNYFPPVVPLDSISLVTPTNGATGFIYVNATFLGKLSYDPQLSTARSGDRLNLSWPTNESGFVLESSQLLAATNQWSSVTNDIVLVNGQHSVTNLPFTTNEFYRLKKILPESEFSLRDEQ